MKILYNQVRRYWWREDEYAMPIIARYGTGGGNMPIILESNQNHATAKEADVCTTLPASMGMGGGYVPMIVDALPFDTTQVTSPGNYSHPKWGDPCHPIANQGHTPKVVIQEMKDEQGNAVSVGNGQLNQMSMSPIANALDCMHDHQAVMINRPEEHENDVAVTLDAHYYKGPGERAGKEREVVADKTTSIVRRLTPKECCRLQGFPDSWVDLGEWVDEEGKTHKDADTPKYKALGNSIAVGFANERSGFWCWLMRRISAQYERRPTQGSLFSGIGGFDLAWAAVNGPESCRWSSEIEQFPIAVMKKHFGDEDAGEDGDFYQAISKG